MISLVFIVRLQLSNRSAPNHTLIDCMFRGLGKLPIIFYFELHVLIEPFKARNLHLTYLLLEQEENYSN